MKFRNILLTTFAASAFVIGTTSCSDSFLDEKMYSSYGPEVSDVNAKLVGLHRQYAAIWGMSSQQGFVGCWQVGTDVGAPGDTQGVEVPFYRYQELNAENAGVSFLWEKLYELINSANQIIASQAEGGDAAAHILPYRVGNSRSHVLSCLCIQYVGDIMGRCTFGDRIY